MAPRRQNQGKVPKCMWFDYIGEWEPLWIMEFTDGSFDEVDGLLIRHRVNNPALYAVDPQEGPQTGWG